ncbi:MAG: hypothetical protein ABGW77_00105 [Campylobacterales bacterium]
MQLKKRECWEGLCFEGEVKKEGKSYILIGELVGEVEVECIKCLTRFKRPIREKVAFKVVKPPFEGFDPEFDIFEMEKFNLREILQSEVESLRSDYNVCPACEGVEFNREF